MLEEVDIARICDGLKLRLKEEGWVLIKAKEVKQLPVSMTLKDAAKELGIHRHTARAMVERGELKKNSQGRVPASEIRRLQGV
ncbi:MAG: helix-turn-helix domain-containing protein [Verrucomicrobiota bacterium]